MKLDLRMAVPEPVPTAEDPFALGWRYVKTGGDELGRIPLTEEDLVYPAEDDFVVNNLAHHEDRDYLMAVFKQRLAGRPELRLLGDHLINFEHRAVRKNLGPDIIVFNGEPLEWNPKRGVFPVKRMKARPLFVVEISTPTTRRKDLTEKPDNYFKVGVPVFVLIDLDYGGGKHPTGITAFQAGPTEYEPLPSEPNGRIWLEVVEVFLAAENNRVVCYDPKGKRIEDYLGLARTASAATRQAARANKRADAEKARADDNARKFAELQAELNRLRSDAK